MQIYMQGDCQLTPTKKQTGGKLIFKGQDYVVMTGETGHKHRLKVKEKEVEVYSIGDQTYLNIKGESKLTHEEHGTHLIPAGWYVVEQEREFDYFANSARKVQD